jgi:uncharacterized membrane protein YfbV (UPF0208 family)
MNLYNDIAVMVKTVSSTLVPSDDLLLYMVYVALVITVITNSRNKTYIQHLLATQLSPAIIINGVKHILSKFKIYWRYSYPISPIAWQTKSLYNDIAVMVKTVSSTLVPSDDLLLYMVYVALVITVSPISCSPPFRIFGEL